MERGASVRSLVFESGRSGAIPPVVSPPAFPPAPRGGGGGSRGGVQARSGSLPRPSGFPRETTGRPSRPVGPVSKIAGQKEQTLAIADLKELIDAGVHFGHRVSRWHPKMKPYIYGKRNLIHIVDLRETLRGLVRAANFL